MAKLKKSIICAEIENQLQRVAKLRFAMSGAQQQRGPEEREICYNEWTVSELTGSMEILKGTKIPLFFDREYIYIMYIYKADKLY